MVVVGEKEGGWCINSGDQSDTRIGEQAGFICEEIRSGESEHAARAIISRGSRYLTAG